MLYKRKDSKSWWCRFTAPNGRRVQRSCQTQDKKAAQEYEDRLKSEYWRVHRLGDRPRYAWQQAVEQYLLESSHKKTLETDKLYLKFADKYLRHLYLDEIDRAVIETLSREKLATGVKPSTVNRHLEVIRTILNKSAREWEWLDKAPYVRMLKEPKKRIRWLTREEADKLLAGLPRHTAAMARFTLATGLRERNVTHLEWSQVDLERRVAWIHADESKSGSAIGIPLNNEATVVLREQQGKHPTRVFTYAGRPVSKANTKAWRKTLERVGIENFRWHDLRHTWASWHVQSGTPLHVLQELGGWSDIRMVQRYAHLSAEHLAAYADNISGLKTVTGTFLATADNTR